jgi:branched-chain amino acid transport system ATP-binding protein
MSALLEVRGLSKRFDGVRVAAGLSLELAAGDRTALIGPNGAGKTSFVNLVGGQLRPDAGSIRLAGADITRLKPAARARLGLVRSFQVTRLFASMTPEEHVALALLQRTGRTGRLYGSYRRMPGIVAEARDILGLLGLGGVAQRPAGTIAYGQQRLLEIALVLALKPRVALLDEPGAGVPPADAGLIERALAQLPAALAVLLIEHDMEFVFRFARRVIVMVGGAIVFSGTPAEAAASPVVRAAYLGGPADAGSGA